MKMSHRGDKSSIQDHTQVARELFRENKNITIEGFCARMQQKFPDLSDTNQLEQYYHRAKADQGLAEDVDNIKKLSQQIFEKCDKIVGRTMEREGR